MNEPTTTELLRCLVHYVGEWFEEDGRRWRFIYVYVIQYRKYYVYKNVPKIKMEDP